MKKDKPIKKEEVENILASYSGLKYRIYDVLDLLTQIDPNKYDSGGDIGDVCVEDDIVSLRLDDFGRYTDTSYVNFPVKYLWMEAIDIKQIEERKKQEALLKEQQDKEASELKKKATQEKREIATYKRLKAKYG